MIWCLFDGVSVNDQLWLDSQIDGKGIRLRKKVAKVEGVSRGDACLLVPAIYNVSNVNEDETWHGEPQRRDTA